MNDQRQDNTTSNASETMAEVRGAQRKLKGIEASLQYSAVVHNTMVRLGNWLLGRGRLSEKGER